MGKNSVVLATPSSADPTRVAPVSVAEPLPIVMVRDDTGGTGGGGGSVPLGDVEVLTLGATAQGLADIPEAATSAFVSVRGAPASIAVAGPDPTPTQGDYWPDLSFWELLSREELLGFRAAAVSGVGVLRVTYYGPAQVTPPAEPK